MRKWILKEVSKFHDDPTINESGILVLLGQVWVYVGKREGFERGRRENKFKRKRECRDVSKM